MTIKGSSSRAFVFGCFLFHFFRIAISGGDCVSGLKQSLFSALFHFTLSNYKHLSETNELSM